LAKEDDEDHSSKVKFDDNKSKSRKLKWWQKILEDMYFIYVC